MMPDLRGLVSPDGKVAEGHHPGHDDGDEEDDEEERRPRKRFRT